MSFPTAFPAAAPQQKHAMITLQPTNSLIMLFSVFLLCFVQHGTFVSAADIYLNEWSVSLDRKPYPKRNVLVGDTITFKLLGPHDVWIYPSENCYDTEDKIIVGMRGDGVAKYTFTEDDIGKTLFFACGAGTHCLMGQYIRLSVYHPDWNSKIDIGITGDDESGAIDRRAQMRLFSGLLLAPTLLMAFGFL